MKRNIYVSLLEWKKSPYRKPLIVSGARQVGKTYVLKEFAAIAEHARGRDYLNPVQ